MDSHVSFIAEHRCDNMLRIEIPENIFPSPRAVSWAINGNGLIIPRVIINHTICDKQVDGMDEYVAGFINQHHFPAESIILLTAVLQKFQGRTEEQYGDLAVRTYATVGLGNALAAGDPVVAGQGFGTINLIVIIAATLTDAALIESVAIATEAKARFLTEQNVRSIISGAPATGTGTDCIVVVSLGGGEKIRYAGKHTKIGELIARTVMSAMKESVHYRLVALGVCAV
jgi:adenosylcobinamide amidohydrolase